MNDRPSVAMRLKSIAQAGLQYGKNPYDIARYTELREIAAQLPAERTDLPPEKIPAVFCNETGYQTPKSDTRAAVFFGT